MIAPAAYCGSGLRAALRLIDARDCVRSPALPLVNRHSSHVTVHHIETTIGGRPYRVEVTPVGSGWRAQLQRALGMPTAMMPFYGATPEEAAGLLTQWLTLAHRRQGVAPPSPATRSRPGRQA